MSYPCETRAASVETALSQISSLGLEEVGSESSRSTIEFPVVREERSAPFAIESALVDITLPPVE
jgi:hypothetical protein